jgi:hypothetical protein
MALPNSGQISLTDIQAEFGGTSPLSLSDYYKGGSFVLDTDYAPNVPRSGAISFSNFYGAKKNTLTTVTFNNPGDNFLILPATFVGNVIVQNMSGGGGGGGGPDSFPGRSGYPGLTITGGNIPASSGSVVNAYVGGGGGAGGSGGGGGGGGGKIICTKLHELGYLPTHIYQADEKFGEWLRQNDPYAYYGYVKWASVVVDWMERDGPQCMFWIRDSKKRGQTQQAMAISWARRIATPWAEHMAYKMGVGEKDNTAGRWIMNTGIWISRIIGRSTKATQPSKNIFLGYLMWLSFGMFWLIATMKREKA